MHPTSLRKTLMHETRDLHDLLDRHVGQMTRPADYRAYLTGTYAFRAAIEGKLDGNRPDEGWQIVRLVDELRADLDDLNETPPPLPANSLRLDDPDARAAVFYVLEGSAIGARLIAKRAQGHGFHAGFGARHLASQTATKDRWPQFLAWLESRDIDVNNARQAARDVFALALTAYGVTSSVA